MGMDSAEHGVCIVMQTVGLDPARKTGRVHLLMRLGRSHLLLLRSGKPWNHRRPDPRFE